MLLAILISSNCHAKLIVKDIFGRNLDGKKITLVDWEGYIANPAIKLSIQPPTNSVFPLVVNLSANNSRLYFDNPSTVGTTGPNKVITFTSNTPKTFYLSIFPDRAAVDENYNLTVNSIFGVQTYSIFVKDHDTASTVIQYPLILDYSYDNQSYSFFSNLTHRNIVKQAADDWAFFIANMNFDQVQAENENTYIWNDDFLSGNWRSNTNAYTGFLLYPHGIHTTIHKSGGAPSSNAFQKIGGVETKLRRSGSYAEVHGNYNTLGWNTTINDNTWYLGTNYSNVANDLYSIALHEIGHAVSFNPGYPIFQNYKQLGSCNAAGVLAYQGNAISIDTFDHLANGNTNDTLKLVDRISKKGAFGSEYASFMPRGRWLITKLNLLMMQSVGYKLRVTSAFKPVTIGTSILPNGIVGQKYNALISANWGIPFFNYSVTGSTSLPAGLKIDSFTGIISGTPTIAGSFVVQIKVTDYDNKSAIRTYNLIIN